MEALQPCPYCGAAATVVHMNDSYDRADYGWDIGCPRWSLFDKYHDHFKPAPILRGFRTKEDAIKGWNAYSAALEE